MKEKPTSASAKRKRRGRGQGTWVTYSRCFLLTLGILFSGLGGIGLWAVRGAGETVPGWLPWILAGCLAMGLWSLVTGLFGGRKDVDSLSEQSSSAHEGVLIVMILAAPLYWILKYLESRRR